MAKTGCRCGVGLWNGRCPGGVNWVIFPLWQFSKIAYQYPDKELYDLDDLIEEYYYEGYRKYDLWLCKRCKRIQIWIDGDKSYVAYEPIDYDGNVPLRDILLMEEWIALSDWDYESSYTGVYVLENYPFRPYRYFLNEDKSKIYVYNRDTKQIEFVYDEYIREVQEGYYKDRKGIYHHDFYEDKWLYVEDGTEVPYEYKDGELSDAVYGFVMGDALGVPYEFRERGSFKCTGMDGYGTHEKPPGTWSDDTALLLATCMSLKENNLKVNIEDMRKKFQDWLFKGEFTADGDVFDVGYTTKKALMTGKGSEAENANGNGSLMRILPLAFVDCTDDEIRAVSAITHGHWIAQEACVIYVNLIRRYVGQVWYGKGKTLKEMILELPEYPKPFDRLFRLSELKEEDIKSSGYVVDTLEAALWCILQDDREYEDCLLRAVNLGDDTDTVAAITGGLAGLKYSFDALPEDWVWKLKNNRLIQKCLW